VSARPVADILLQITGRRRERVPAMAPAATPARRGGSSLAATLDNRFLTALAANRGRAIIAEVKMGSPRLGSLVGKVDPESQARAYATHGAAALSVVVEPDFFHGSYELLARCKGASGLPAIAKDFVVSERQLDWALAAGADAVLLIAALHSGEELRAYAASARDRGLVPLVETHDREDLEKLTGDPWELVGVNNRDLRTFQIDLENSIALAPQLPAAALKVAESGIRERCDIARLRVYGFVAFLIGETLLLAAEPGRVLEELRA
jgi:indole-3-glycerol phosphate synthase